MPPVEPDMAGAVKAAGAAGAAGAEADKSKVLSVAVCSPASAGDCKPVEDSIELAFTLSRNRRPVISVCAALRLGKLEMVADKITVLGELYLHAANENSDVGHWEPLVEPWNVSFECGQALDTEEDLLVAARSCLEVSADFLQVNLTYSVVQVATAMACMSWQSRPTCCQLAAILRNTVGGRGGD